MSAASNEVAAAGPRRLLTISHSREVGGAEVYLQNLLRYLTQGDGVDRWLPQLVCRRDEVISPWASEISNFCPVFRVDVVRVADVLKLTRLIRQATVVHLNLSFPAGKYQFAAALLARSVGRPLVVTHHLALPVPQPWHSAMRWLGGAADRHIAVSHHAHDVLVNEFGYAPDRIVVVHNGIDADRFHPATEAARTSFRQAGGQLLDGHPWGGDVLVACTVARLSPQKGLFDLVDATALVVKDMPRTAVVVIGEGELHRRLEKRARDLGLSHHFFLAGAVPRERVAEWLAAADLFILPSHYEGGPATALMEAMASGCGVIVTDVTGVKELVTDSTLGRLVPARNSTALAAAMVDLLTDPNERARMAERARLKVTTDFTIEACLRRTVAIFDEVAARTNA